MAYSASVLRVMIASPGDVSQERNLAREVIHEWNAIHSAERGLVLLPVGWDSNASPEMGGRPQSLINKQILRDCDLLIAIFWTRLGSPTGTAASGTVEEIEEHLRSGKPALIYFSTAPVKPASVDPDQYKALTAFRDSCRARGLVEEYEDLPSFGRLLNRHLAQTVIRQFGGAPAVEMGAAAGGATGSARARVSTDAKNMLDLTAADAQGSVLLSQTIAGWYIGTNDHKFVEGGNAREEARWRAAADELHQADLISLERHSGSLIGTITHAGYQAAEPVEPGPASDP